MLDVVRVIGTVLGGYLLGGVPFGIVVSRFLFHTDITAQGSGSTGATNVYRALGWKAALPVGILDFVKGSVPPLVAFAVAGQAGWSADARDWLAIAAGLAAVAGHSYSPYFGLRGGKGVATAGGLALVLVPGILAFELSVFALLVFTVRIVSVASLVVAVAFPFLVWRFYSGRPALIAFSVIAASLVIWRHRANIVRLARGEEPRIDKGGISILRGGSPASSGPSDGEGSS